MDVIGTGRDYLRGWGVKKNGDGTRLVGWSKLSSRTDSHSCDEA